MKAAVFELCSDDRRNRERSEEGESWRCCHVLPWNLDHTFFSVVEPGTGPGSAVVSILDTGLPHSFGETELKRR